MCSTRAHLVSSGVHKCLSLGLTTHPDLVSKMTGLDSNSLPEGEDLKTTRSEAKMPQK